MLVETQFEAYTLAKFARFGPKDASMLKTSVPFRLYHSQSESFIHASCDAEKDRAHPDGRKVGKQSNALSFTGDPTLSLSGLDGSLSIIFFSD